ncbi:MAG TPA: polysaccharide deacetylase family protein [Solirubrobacteraceae bacterium]|jgi:peptidoglycan/xylan/chitin deacetylase (PgdA/CDA1 family)|nr:polysaccharide deacetylase family protein [Solirubrobacteraceae bacterium]
MHDQPTSTSRAVGSGAQSVELPRAPRVTSAVFQRRRRRAAAAAAIGIVALISLIAGISTGSGHGNGAASIPLGSAPSTSFFARIHALAGTGSGSFEARQVAAENGAINHTLAYTPFVRIAGSEKREIALTFDDGPGPYTPAILSVLERKHVPATFFEVGFMLRWFSASTGAIVARGDPIGDHTMLHQPMSQLSENDQRNALLDEAATISQYGAPFPRLFRPPYGAYNAKTLALLHKYGMLMVMWTVDSNDYLEPGVATIVHNVVSGARPGAIILMHDAGGNRQETVDALPTIIKHLRARGYRLVTVPRLLLDNPAPHDQDVVASAHLGAG